MGAAPRPKPMSRRPPLSWSSMQISSISRREHARRWRHAERRRVMLGEMIGVETGAIVGLGHFEAVLVIVREGAVVAIKMIKDTEFHFFNACADLLTPRVLRLRLQLFLSLRQG